jgi:hypothetical protein
MTMYHHDSRSYHEAATDAGNNARRKMEELIENGRKNAMTVLNKVISEVPEDRIVRGPALKFGVDDQRRLTVDIGGKVVEHLHKNAGQQVAERGPVSIPMKLVNELLDVTEKVPVRIGHNHDKMVEQPALWARQLLADNFNVLYQHTEERFLTRSHGGQVRGFLSNKFRRLDSRPILDAAMDAFKKLGALPIEAYATDVRVTFKAILPRIFEPVPNEPVLIGVAWSNSDYGNGAHSLRAYVLRPWCTNYAITEECLREIHVGGRLSEDDVFSNQTYALDTRRSASMVKDLIEASLAPQGVNKVLAAVHDANEEKVDPKKIGEYLKKQLGAGKAKEVIEAFNSADVVNMPPGQTKWRMSNAISWIAGKETDVEKKLELMQQAGHILDVQAAKKAA